MSGVCGTYDGYNTAVKYRMAVFQRPDEQFCGVEAEVFPVF